MPAIIRRVKQIGYALLALGIIFLISFFIVLPQLDLLWRREAPPSPEREMIEVESVDAIPHGTTVDIVARVRNPNPRVGVPDYPVSFILLDKDGNEIEIVSERTYLLPGSLNYIAVIDVAIPTAVSQVRVDTPQAPVFADNPPRVDIPSFNSFLRNRQLIVAGDRRLESQKGIVANVGNLGFQQVDITGVALDKNDKVVGVGKTFIGELNAGEQREFTIQWPEPTSETSKVIVLPATNIYKEENILQIVGDPARLRD